MSTSKPQSVTVSLLLYHSSATLTSLMGSPLLLSYTLPLALMNASHETNRREATDNTIIWFDPLCIISSVYCRWLKVAKRSRMTEPSFLFVSTLWWKRHACEAYNDVIRNFQSRFQRRRALPIPPIPNSQFPRTYSITLHKSHYHRFSFCPVAIPVVPCIDVAGNEADRHVW